jgi:hypothetical protein
MIERIGLSGVQIEGILNSLSAQGVDIIFAADTQFNVNQPPT